MRRGVLLGSAAVVAAAAVGFGVGWAGADHDHDPDATASATALTSVTSVTAVTATAVPDDGPDAGFARDMSVHHAQAVAMAEAIRERTTDPDLALLAEDMALTQQAQIGRFAGWLEQWGLPNASLDPPMAWAGHGGHTDHGMPGMADPDEIAALSSDPIEEAERDFLTLMIAHHRGGVEMAEAVLPLTDREEVLRIARSIIDAQTSEIGAMEAMLAERGG